MADPHRFGRLYGDLVGSGPREASLAAQRARLLMRARNASPQPRRHPGWMLATGGAALLLVATFSLTSLLDSTPLSADWQGAPVDAGMVLVAEVDHAAPLQFSDGSRIVLDPSTVAAVDQIAEKQAGLRLEQGRVTASIQKQSGVAWTIAAGPYEVRVLGTKFAVDWDAQSRRFNVSVEEGVVRVAGGNLPSKGIELAAGQVLERSGAVAQQEPSAAGEIGEPEPSPAAPEPPEEATPSAPPIAVTPTPEPRQKARKASPAEPIEDEADDHPDSEAVAWQALANDGDYAGALSAAESMGFESVMSQSGAGDLLLLANAARYARSARRAKQAYQAVRTRFPQSHSARLSAFYLARLAGDVEGQPRTEARWLRTYLDEAPRGELAASARARLMETLRGLGDMAGAKSIAREYLKYHPKGPHADVARSISRNTGQP